MDPGMSATQMLALAAKITKAKRESQHLLFEPIEKQRQACNSRKKIVAVFGSNRCLGAETEVFDPVMGCHRRVDSIDGNFHVLAWGGDELVVAQALAPFQKEPQDLYEFRLDNGQTFVASATHLALTPSGYQQIGDAFDRTTLDVQPAFELILPGSTSDNGLLTHGEGGPRCMKTVPDSQSDYSGGPRPCGERPLSSLADDQYSSPSQAGVQTHTRSGGDDLRPSSHSSGSCTPSDDLLGAIPSDTRAYQAWNPPSIEGAPHQHEGRAVDFECCDGGKPSRLADHTLQRFHQSGHGLSLGPQTPEPCLQASRNPSRFSSLTGLAHASITSTAKIVSVCHLRKDVVWDFEVPVYGNYLCAGVIHHNSGKSTVSAFDLTCHATGRYPDWWLGPRYTRPVSIAVIGKTNRATREVMQKALLGPIWDIGTGMIPKDAIAKPPTKQQGVADSIDTAFVNHVSGGVSTIQFYSCQMDVGVAMGQDWDIAAFDEEPSPEWYRQARMRIVSRNGFLFLTFTPEDGYTEIVNLLMDMDEDMIERIIITVDDAGRFYPKEERERLEKELPEWEKEFRLYGRPSMGEKGRVFRYPRDSYEIDPMDPEPTWRRVAGLDVGFGHATTAIDLYIDDSTPMATFYAIQEYFSKEELPDVHSAKLRAWGDVDFYIDPSSKRRAPTDGKNLYTMYEERGLNLVPANNDVDASIIFINQLLANRQLYVSKDCPNLLEQMGLYRRVVDKKTNRAIIHKKNQDCIDALRYAIMAHEYARVPYRRAPKPHELVPKVEIKQWKPFDMRMGY